MSEFFHMDGYGFYVWTSYALTLIVLLANFISPMLRRQELLRALARKARRKTRT
ncbi:MAG: heme exporter protein CcmD [Gammaproteobacteria bacterium]|nr:heme exporter protein CcmD [Gammaproteobacteria bacterium]